MNPERPPSFLVRSLRNRGQPKSQEWNPNVPTMTDWESFNYSGRIGKKCETVITSVVTGSTVIPKGVAEELAEVADIVSGFINHKLEQIPITRATFPNSLLHPIYADALEREATKNAVELMALGIDSIFQTGFTQDYLDIFGQLDEIPDGREIPKKARHLVDGLLTIARFLNDKPTLETLSSYGSLLPNLHMGVVQIDGVFLGGKPDIPLTGDGKEKEEYLKSISRRPRIKRFKNTVDNIVDGCVYLEIKTVQKAKYVARRPISHTPRKHDVQKAVQNLCTVCCETDIALAPEKIVFLYLGSLQPTRIHEIPCDIKFWQDQATLMEEIIVYGYGDFPDYQRPEFAPYLDFATNMAEEMKNKLPKFPKTKITKRIIKENENAQPLTLKGLNLKKVGPGQLHPRKVSNRLLKLAEARRGKRPEYSMDFNDIDEKMEKCFDLELEKDQPQEPMLAGFEKVARGKPFPLKD